MKYQFAVEFNGARRHHKLEDKLTQGTQLMLNIEKF